MWCSLTYSTALCSTITSIIYTSILLISDPNTVYIIQGPKDTIRGKDEQPRLSPLGACVISWPRHWSGIFGWEASWCTGRQGRGLRKEERLGPDALCIRTKTSFNWITFTMTEPGRLEYFIWYLKAHYYKLFGRWASDARRTRRDTGLRQCANHTDYNE
jgi:hypothetical protein